MKKEEGADDTKFVDGQFICQAQKQKDADVDINGRQDAHGPAEVEPAQAN